MLWATVSEPIQDDTAVGLMILLPLGLGFVACAALLMGGSKFARR